MTYPLTLKKLLIRTGIARFLPGVQRLTEGGGEFLHYYSDRVLAAPYREWCDTSAFGERPSPDAIDLSLGAPRFDLVPSGSTKLPADRRGAPPPWGLPELRAAVAEKLLTDQLLTTDPDDGILITQGVSGAFATALDTFINPGDRVVLFDPTSPLYILALRHRRAHIRWLSTWTDEGHTRFHPQHLASALYRARMIVVASPGNPTGGVMTAEDLEQIAWWAERRDVLIFSDTAFERYCYEDKPLSIGSLPKAEKRTLTAGSLSKGHALASARVGWLAGHRHLVRPCTLTAALQTTIVPTQCQQVALTALRQDNEVFEPIREEFSSRRRYAYERLRAAGLNPLWPAGAFFFWVPVWELGMSGAPSPIGCSALARFWSRRETSSARAVPATSASVTPPKTAGCAKAWAGWRTSCAPCKLPSP